MFISNSGSRGYTIANSLRLRSSASARISRTPSASNRRTYTWAGWVKRGTLGAVQTFFSATAVSATDDTNLFGLQFDAGDTISVGGGATTFITTTAVYRDPSAWLHIVLAMDTTQATAANRVKLYINGTQVTALSVTNYTSLNLDTAVNSAVQHNLSSAMPFLTRYFDGYLSDVYFIDGQALTPSSFGQTDTNGVWVPKAYSGTYGTNGFYLKFNDGSSTTNLCLDRSGNGNNWTPSGISVSAGSTYDWMVDTPTNNYAVLNAVAKASTQPTFGDGNLKSTVTPAAWGAAIGSVGVVSGKHYWELVVSNTDAFVGICGDNISFGSADPQTSSGTILYYAATGQKRIDGTLTAYGSSFTSTNTIGVALDVDGGTVTFYRDNVSQGSISLSSSTLNGKTVFPIVINNASNTQINFGQRPFQYSPPTSFKALATNNLPAVTIAKPSLHFDIKTRTGTGASANITGYSFSPDLVWIKSRGRALDNTLYDRLRGTQARLESNATDAEVTTDAGLTAFNSDGYTLNTLDQVNGTTATNSFVDWAWRANGAGVTNTAGSITSTVSANTTAGFSIVTYTGTGANATVGHGLGVAPKMVIVKNRGVTDVWMVYHTAMAATEYIILNRTDAKATLATVWNSTAPASTVFSIGTLGDVNRSTNNYVAYCFAEVSGYSRFGSYTGNGSADGSFVYTGFRPRYLLIKNSSNATGYPWNIIDTAREPYNTQGIYLLANSSGAEGTASYIDITANGFKLRNAGAGVNGSGDTYIFAAFAENPFGGSNIAPSPAR